MAARHAMEGVLSMSVSRYARNISLFLDFFNNMKAKGVEITTLKEGALNTLPFIFK